MTSADQSPSAAPLSDGEHLTTISYDGNFWEVYLEFQDDAAIPVSYRALLCFIPSSSTGAPSAWRTTAILIESSHDAVMSKARAFGDFELQSLLRSVLPDSD